MPGLSESIRPPIWLRLKMMLDQQSPVVSSHYYIKDVKQEDNEQYKGCCDYVDRNRS